MTSTRRETLIQMSAVTALLGTLIHPAQAATRRGSAARELPDWVRKTDELTAFLRAESLSVADWRTGLDQLFAQVSLDDILRDTDFTARSEAAGFAEKGVATANIKWDDGTNRRLSFFSKIFAIGKGRAIIPHGHAGMVSAHLPLSGAMHLRQYDQLERNETALRIRPTVDREVRPGDLSSIGMEADNIHWFVATEPAHTLDTIVTGVDESAAQAFDIFNLDMDEASREPNGDLIAPRMGVAEALAKYG
ncbi:hypothetical protein [Parvularcula marina]|uniref:Cupin domain-containing protein n=1 Tax=Parvularcula marina TaxID=2292771 RepID=A0A371RJW3_9PROT|nr:hypothetical protein [Parvularcula marina]RFB05742.1 hypothetical protein DX908_10965 [Parvularcula marina]